jgi:hypothetical protein
METRKTDDQYSDEEAACRRDAVIKHMLSKPPEPRAKPQLRPSAIKESSPKSSKKA